jgi:hypothetical protein
MSYLYDLSPLNEYLQTHKDIHWIKKTDSGSYDLILDNTLFSTFRSCPQLFFDLYAEGYKPKSQGGRSWILDFGILFHAMVEIYYKEFRTPGFDPKVWALEVGSEKWEAANMNVHSNHREFISMNGMMGFCLLLLQYAERFSADNERIRVIATEISFGRNKEVPLGSIFDGVVNVYLSGRIDVLVDDRDSICPLDHKTKGTLKGDYSKFYEIDEGPTGYVYALNKILPSILEAAGAGAESLSRDCNKIIMNYISKSIPKDPSERFARKPIYKTQAQLNSYQQRMLLSAEDLFTSLVRYSSTGLASRHTNVCTMHFGSDCVMLPVHSQNSPSNELTVLNALYERKKIWNTEEV